MLRYEMASLIKRKAGRKVLPAPQPSLGLEADYLKALRAMLREMASWSAGNMLPSFKAEKLRMDHAVLDANPSVFRAFDDFVVGLIAKATDMVGRILGLESKRHSKQFMSIAKRTLGIDLSSVIRDEDLDSYMEAAALRNASLIKGLAEDTTKRVKDVVLRSLVSGESSKDLQKTLAAQFKFSERRAELIARDQMGKLNSDLTRIRQQQAGISSYVWTTSHDERVRPRHQALEGKVYKWGEATGAEEGLPPGQPIQCRCIARAIVEY